jgi:hypothetical protein
MATSTVAIAGFTGKLARLVTQNLLENHPGIKIHGIARSANKVDDSIRAHSAVTIFEASATDTTTSERPSRAHPLPYVAT